MKETHYLEKSVMKANKPRILTIGIFITFLIVIHYLNPIVNQNAVDSFNYLPKFILTGVIVLALNYFILQNQINNWGKKGVLIFHSTYFFIAILLIFLIIFSLFYNLIPLNYVDFVFFTICYCILKSFKKS